MQQLLCVLLCMGTLAVSQELRAQVTLDQLDAKMAAESDALEAFRARLEDPDPVRARAAMKLLIAKGDDAQKRMAIAHGFEATDPVIRLEAVRAILDSNPRLLYRWVPVDTTARLTNNYRNAITAYKGNLEEGRIGRISVQIDGYSDEEKCWLAQGSQACFARINAGELSLRFFSTQGWSQFILNRDGQLVGKPSISGTRVDAFSDLTK